MRGKALGKHETVHSAPFPRTHRRFFHS